MKPDMVLLAAGDGRRFGENKLTHEIDGKPMFRHALERARFLQKEGLLRRVVLVTQYDEVARAAKEAGAEVVINDRPDLGISRSLKLGLRHLENDADSESEACVFGVCDQPYLRAETMRKLIRLFSDGDKGIAACACGGTIGNPVIFSKKYYAELLELTGDVGGKRVLNAHRGDAVLLETAREELEDVDVRYGEFFPFLNDGKRHVISLVGAGGKSTTMRFLARTFASRGLRAVETTTTHILFPEDDSFVPVQRQGLEVLEERWAKNLPCTVGEPKTRVAPDGAEIRKLSALSPLLLSAVIDAADVTLIEADGARCLPMKAPAEHEPVIHPATDVVIAVLGMKAMGRKLSEVCFRPELAAEIIGADPASHVVAPEDFAALFLSGKGGRKLVGERDYLCLINQCDSEEDFAAAKEVAARMAGTRVVASGHDGEKHVFRRF